MATERKIDRAKAVVVKRKVESFAYASLLCDDVMIDAVKVLIHSLKATGTAYPFLLLTLPGVTQTDDLIRLGAILHPIPPLEYPFKVSAEKAAINKMCRYSKLHIWRFTQYKKIVFVDVDTLIAQNIDTVFRWPEFSAVRDAGDTFNTGLFVLQPSTKTYKRMVDSYFSAPSYNQGDQGFLNWFFRNSAKHALPIRYNTVCKSKSLAMWPLMRQQARMLHYTSETKPWTFFSGAHRFWRQNYDPMMFYQWARAYRHVAKKLQIDVYDHTRTQWFNADRVDQVCQRAVNTALHPNDHQVSVIVYKWRSIASLETALFHYRRVVTPIVAKIYISWNPSQGTLPPELAKYKMAKDPSVQVIMHRFESVGNIFQPIPGLATRAVFVADDEHLPDLERLEIALEAFKNNPWSLVGFFAKYHGKVRLADFDDQTNSTLSTPYQSISVFDDRYQWVYNQTMFKRPRPYSMITAPLMLVSSEYLFAYTCLLPERIHRFLDEQDEDGADLAMNLLAAGMSGARPILVKSDLADPEASRFSGSDPTLFAHTKGKLLQELSRMFVGSPIGKDVLLFNNVAVAQFNKIPFRKRSIKRWNDL